jgi:ATP-dependent exoDNAse (exonuclease V) beta subunit
MNITKNINFQDLIELEECFSDILFLEKDHKYMFSDIPAKMSVSGLIKKYEKPFDSQKIAKFVADRDGFSTEDILEQWEFSKNYSCHKGSEFHKFVENYLNRKKTTIDKDAIELFFSKNKKFYTPDSVKNYYSDLALNIKNFMNFYNWWKQDHILLKPEFVIGDKESGICGTIDNLSYNKKTKELVIFDYKTNKEIKKSNPRKETFLKELKHIQQCEYTKYSLQLSLYSTIIEKNSNFKVPKSYIVWVSGKENYDLIECLDFKKESLSLLGSIE